MGGQYLFHWAFERGVRGRRVKIAPFCMQQDHHKSLDILPRSIELVEGDV